MLLVIFGAGASYDSVPSRSFAYSQYNNLPDRPPLANQLFEDRPEFVEDLDHFPLCKPIVPHLRTLRPGVSFEQTLQRFQMEEQQYPRRVPQLAAVRFYLRRMLWRCEDRWAADHRDVTNYATLLDQLDSWRPQNWGPILLVTFNYDRMLERALLQFGRTFDDIPAYIASNRFPLFKLHGSVNWGRRVQTQIRTERRGLQEIINELIERMSNLQFTSEYAVLDHYEKVNDRSKVYFPALALPVEQKVDFECPESHVNALMQMLPKVTHILTIGWRATEIAFLDLLKKTLADSIYLQVVAKDGHESNEIADRLEAQGFVKSKRVYSGGFTDFVLSRAGEMIIRPGVF